MSKSLINPFELLNINEKSTIREARKSYYQLALLCHPDCGGNEESMKVLANAYEFVETQLKNKNDIIGDGFELNTNLEKEFEEFNKNIKREIPLMRDLYDMANEQNKVDKEKRNYKNFNDIFNTNFDEEKYQYEELVLGLGKNPFEKGYQYLMDDDKDQETDDDYVIPPTNKFKNEIQIYKEPHILPDDYGNEFRFDVEEINDFSNYAQQEYDYVKAHSELENEPTEIKSEKDQPMTDLMKAMEELIQERSGLNINHTQIVLDFELV